MDKTQRDAMIKFVEATITQLQAPHDENDWSHLHQSSSWQMMVGIAANDPSQTGGDLALLKQYREETYAPFVKWFGQATVEAKLEMMEVFGDNVQIFKQSMGAPQGDMEKATAAIAANMQKELVLLKNNSSREEEIVRKTEETYPVIKDITKQMQKAGIAADKVKNSETVLVRALQDDYIDTYMLADIQDIQKSFTAAGGKAEINKDYTSLDIEIGNKHFTITPKNGIEDSRGVK